MACINVHMQDVISSRLSATISRVGGGLSVDIDKATSPFLASAVDTTKKHLSVDIGKATPFFLASAVDTIKKHLSVRTSIVCSLSEVIAFLKVTPNELQWITDDMGVFFDVESNVDWIIVTS